MWYLICGILYTLVPPIIKHSLTLNQEKCLAVFKQFHVIKSHGLGYFNIMVGGKKKTEWIVEVWRMRFRICL